MNDRSIDNLPMIAIRSDGAPPGEREYYRGSYTDLVRKLAAVYDLDPAAVDAWARGWGTCTGFGRHDWLQAVWRAVNALGEYELLDGYSTLYRMVATVTPLHARYVEQVVVVDGNPPLVQTRTGLWFRAEVADHPPPPTPEPSPPDDPIVVDVFTMPYQFTVSLEPITAALRGVGERLAAALDPQRGGSLWQKIADAADALARAESGPAEARRARTRERAFRRAQARSQRNSAYPAPARRRRR